MGMKQEAVIFLAQKFQEGDVVTERIRKIASYISNEGIESHLICFGEEEREQETEDLKVHHVNFQLHGDNYFSWSMLVQNEFIRKIRELNKNKEVLLIHGNDWLTVPASLVASKVFDLPLVITYHSIEEERGMDKPHSGQISELERQGVEESSYILVHREETRRALEVYDLPEGKIKLLDGENWEKDVFKIYENSYKVAETSEKLKAEGEVEHENFNAYMGVSA